MLQPSIRRVMVWTAPLRLAHWLMAASVLALLATGVLMTVAPDLRVASRDYHYIAGYVLIIALALRLYLLLFAAGTAHWRDCLPRGPQLRAALVTLRFYFSFGRTPLPNWYAHNPLWGPVYLLLFALLLLQVVSGLAYTAPYLVGGLSLPVLHAGIAKFVAAFTVAHVAAVFLHDLKGDGGDVSAMINGHRVFVIRPPEPDVRGGVHEVSVDTLRWPKRDDDKPN
jgi:Ni/Fe-hydrogenase 1 B-type cytochrome subunit